MASSGTNAKWSLGLDDQVSAPARAAGDSIEALRQRISGGEDAIKNMRAAFNRLRGSTDEVKAAKTELTAKLNAERDAISAANLALLKSGTTYDSVSAKAKKLAKEQEDMKKSSDAERTKALGNALSAAGGPAASLKDKIATLTETLSGEGAMSAVATFGLAAMAAAVVAVSVALVAGIVKLGQWVIATANASRSMNLFREAAAGSRTNAINLGTQVDALAEKVPTAKNTLNELATTLAKGGIQGQTLVDTLNAVGQASAAMGDDAGGKLKELVDRGRLTQRFQVNPLELQGTGLQFDDIAKSLAKNMNVGINDARRALVEGRVKLGDGAAALKRATEEKFGDINLRKSLDIDVIATKFQERLAGLTKDVNLEPLLQGLNRLSMLFDTSSTTGAALKVAIDAFGKVMVTTLVASMPFLEMFLKGMIIGALDLGIGILRLRNSLVKTFGGSTLGGIDGMALALSIGKSAAVVLAGAVALAGVALAAAVAPVVALVGAFIALDTFSRNVGLSIREFFVGTDWKATGLSIIDGLVNGLKNGAGLLKDAIVGLATGVKDDFKNVLGIHSPSTVFADYGVNTTEGYAQGVEQGTPAAARALDAMATPPAPKSLPSSASSGSATASVGPISLVFNYYAAPGAQGDVAAQVNEPSVRAALMKLLQEAFLGAGIPVST